MPRAIRVQRAMAERHLREPHFYVRTVGVRTALQGQGIGSMLMQPTLERADSAGLPTYIEASSERSAALYERLGFLHTGMLELPDGGPPVWPMRRPPAEFGRPASTGIWPRRARRSARRRTEWRASPRERGRDSHRPPRSQRGRTELALRASRLCTLSRPQTRMVEPLQAVSAAA